MDKVEKENPKKSKTSDVIIFSPQELVDLGILQNIHQVQQSPDVKSSKKRIIEVIQKSINASKEQPSTSKSPKLLPVVNSQELRKNLMGKLSSSQIPSTSTKKVVSKSRLSKLTSKTTAKIINSEIIVPKIPLSGKVLLKSPDSGILIPSSINKKLKKNAFKADLTSLSNDRSILNKDERIKEIIMSAVRSNSKEGCSLASNILKETKTPESNSSYFSVQDESVHSLINYEETKLSKNDIASLIKLGKTEMKKYNVAEKDNLPAKMASDSAKTEIQDMTSKVSQSDIDKPTIIKLETESFDRNLTDSFIEETSVNNSNLHEGYTSIKLISENAEGKFTLPEQTETEVIQEHLELIGKKEIKVFSNTQVSLTKEQLKNLITPQVGKDDFHFKAETQNTIKVEPTEILFQETENRKTHQNLRKSIEDKNAQVNQVKSEETNEALYESNKNNMPSKDVITDLDQPTTDYSDVDTNIRQEMDLNIAGSSTNKQNLVVKKVSSSEIVDDSFLDSTNLQGYLGDSQFQSSAIENQEMIVIGSLMQREEKRSLLKLDKLSVSNEEIESKTDIQSKSKKKKEKNHINKCIGEEKRKEKLKETYSKNSDLKKFLSHKDLGDELENNLDEEYLLSEDSKSGINSQFYGISNISDDKILKINEDRITGLNITKKEVTPIKELPLTSESCINSKGSSSSQVSNIEKSEGKMYVRELTHENMSNTIKPDSFLAIDESNNLVNNSHTSNNKVKNDEVSETPTVTLKNVEEVHNVLKIKMSGQVTNMEMNKEQIGNIKKIENINPVQKSVNNLSEESLLGEERSEDSAEDLKSNQIIESENIAHSEVLKTVINEEKDNIGVLSKKVILLTKSDDIPKHTKIIKKKKPLEKNLHETLEDFNSNQSNKQSMDNLQNDLVDSTKMKKKISAKLKQTSSTDTFKLSKKTENPSQLIETSQVSSSAKPSNIALDSSNEGCYKESLHDKNALEMLITVGKKLQSSTSIKLIQANDIFPLEPLHSEKEQNDNVLQKIESSARVPKKRGRPRKIPLDSLKSTSIIETEIDKSVINNVQKQTTIPLEINKMPKQSVNNNPDLLLNKIKATTDILGKAHSHIDSSTKQTNIQDEIPKEQRSGVKHEMQTDDMRNETAIKFARDQDVFSYQMVKTEKDENLVSGDIMKQEENLENQISIDPLVNPSTNVPKKRGRPRKNPLDPPKPKKPKADSSQAAVLNSSIDSVNLDIVEMDISKSGRKRRKINYFNMENSFMDDLSDIKSKSHSSDTEEDKKFLTLKKRKISFETSIDDSEKSSTNDNQGNNEILRDKPNISGNSDSVESFNTSLTEETTELSTLDNPRIEVKMEPGTLNMSQVEEKMQSTLSASHIEEKMELSTDDVSENELKQNKLKTKKYNWTGETQKMLQSIFSAAVKASTPQTDNKDVSSHQDSSVNPTTPKPIFKPKGRPKKTQICTRVVIDDEGKVKCCTCNTKVINKEWQSHNRNVHYNLAWREGEPFLSVDDHVFVRRTLTPILHEDKSLLCFNCNKEFHVANEFIAHREDCLGIVKNDMVTCAICSEEVDHVKWLSHKKKKHNNLTWRIGDPALDLNNQDLVVTVLNALYKAKIPLYCYKCKDSKKSVVGFLSHQSQCGVDVENAKIPCPLCGKRILPVSFPSHNKLVHEPKPHKTGKPDDMAIGSNEHGSGSHKRKAAKQAMKMIDVISKAKMETIFAQQYVESPNLKEEEFVLKLLKEELKENDILKCKFGDCNFEHKEWEQMIEHLDDCRQKPEQYFVCKKCFSIYCLEEDVRNHVREKHNINLRDDADYIENENSDDENEEKYKQNLARIRRHEIQQAAKNVNIKIKPRFLQTLPKAKNRLCPSAFEYTLEFYNEHYTESVLFDRLRYLKSDWNLLNNELLEEYLPKIEHSCLVTTKVVSTFNDMLKENHDFNIMELFDVVEEEAGATIFCGGPVTAMIWLPTPHILLYCKQVLAVAVEKDFGSKYLVNMNYNESCIIQFWDFGVLKKKITPQKPRFLFGLAVDYGPIWHMEWCPSGCYDEKIFNNDRLQRMGLLAVAGSVPTVNIYSIPFITNDDEMNLIYQSKPLVRLQLFREYDNAKAKCFPTRISWSKASGHRYVAVGYTDGMVAIFDIETTSDILKIKDELGVESIFPYKTLKAHTQYISVLSLIHLGGGTRYLLTGSFDRNVCVWDLNDDSYSVFPRRKILSDGTWLTNWIAYATTADESNTNNATATTCIASHRNYMYEITHMLGSPSSITSLSSSDWLNGLLQGTTSGEILVTFPGQLLYGLDNDKRLKSLRWLLGYTKLINMSLTPDERVKEYEEEKKLAKLMPRKPDCDRDTAAYIFNQGNKLKKYQPHTYENTIEKYGLVICDMKRKSFEEVSKFNLPDVLEPSRPDLYPLQAINKVAFNPNSQSSLYFAAGYQAGFVRLRYMKFLENDKQVV